jgi:hypothetical protein
MPRIPQKSWIVGARAREITAKRPLFFAVFSLLWNGKTAIVARIALMALEAPAWPANVENAEYHGKVAFVNIINITMLISANVMPGDALMHRGAIAVFGRKWES